MQSTDALGRTTRSFYDTQGRVLKREFDDFTSVLTEYDALGNRTAETNPLGERREFTYDPQGRLIRVTLPEVVDPATGGRVRPAYAYGYDSNGNQTSITDPLGRETRFAFDSRGRQVGRTLPDGLTERTIYDDRSLLDVTAAGEPLEQSTALGQTEYAIDFPSEGGEGRVTAYRYDNTALGGGRLAAKLYYATEAAYLADRADGVLTSAAERIELTYDAHGREVESRFYRQEGTTDLTTTTYDADGRTLAVASPEGTVRYEYDALGRKTAVSTGDPLAPTTRTEYSHDTLGRLQTVAAAWLDGVDVADRVTTYRYDKSGRLDALLRPGDLVTDYVYDALGRLDVLTDFLDADRDAALDDGEMVLARYDYDLRADGKRVGVTEIDDLGRTTRIDWAYDALGRLSSERYDSWQTFEDYTSEFAYDLASNRIEKRVDRGSDGTVDAVTRSAFDANDRLIRETLDDVDDAQDRFTEFTFTGTQQSRKLVYRGITDNNPRESDTRYAYNLQGALGRVVAREYGDTGILIAESATEFQYDEDGVRVAETDVNFGTRREFLIDRQNPTGHAKPIEERASGLLVRSYTLGSTVLAQFESQQSTQPGSKLLLLDGHGSTRLLWDLATSAILQRYRYTADGLPIGFDPSTAQTTFLFGGDSQYNQAVGLYYHLARWRQAGAGWLTLDPFIGNLEDPLSLNKYLFVHGDSVNGIDPTGRSYIPDPGFLSIVPIVGSAWSFAHSLEKAINGEGAWAWAMIDLGFLVSELFSLGASGPFLTTIKAGVFKAFSSGKPLAAIRAVMKYLDPGEIQFLLKSDSTQFFWRVDDAVFGAGGKSKPYLTFRDSYSGLAEQWHKWVPVLHGSRDIAQNMSKYGPYANCLTGWGTAFLYSGAAFISVAETHIVYHSALKVYSSIYDAIMRFLPEE